MVYLKLNLVTVAKNAFLRYDVRYIGLFAGNANLCF